MFTAYPKLEEKLKGSIVRFLEGEGKIERKGNPRDHKRIEYSEEHKKVLANGLELTAAQLSNAAGHDRRTELGASGQGKRPDDGARQDGSAVGQDVQPRRPDRVNTRAAFSVCCAKRRPDCVARVRHCMPTEPCGGVDAAGSHSASPGDSGLAAGVAID